MRLYLCCFIWSTQRLYICFWKPNVLLVVCILPGVDPSTWNFVLNACAYMKYTKAIYFFSENPMLSLWYAFFQGIDHSRTQNTSLLRMTDGEKSSGQPILDPRALLFCAWLTTRRALATPEQSLFSFEVRWNNENTSDWSICNVPKFERASGWLSRPLSNWMSGFMQIKDCARNRNMCCFWMYFCLETTSTVSEQFFFT